MSRNVLILIVSFLIVLTHPAAGQSASSFAGTPAQDRVAVVRLNDASEPASAIELDAYAAHLIAAHALLKLDDVAAAHRQLELVPPGMRGWAWRFMRSRLDRSLETLSLKAPALAVQFSEGGKILASVDPEALRLWDVASRTLHDQRPFVAPLHDPGRVIISDDLRYVAALTQSETSQEDLRARARIDVIDTTTGASILAIEARPHDGFTFSKDSTRFAVRHLDGGISVFALPEGVRLTEIPCSASPSGAVSLAPDGATVVAVNRATALGRWDAATGAPLEGLEMEPVGVIMNVSYSPDGTRLAVANIRGWVLLHDLESGTTRPLRQERQPAETITFSDDGRMLAVQLPSGKVNVLDTATGNVVAEARGRPASGDTVDVSRAGSLIATCADEGVKLFAAAPAPEVLTLTNRDSILDLEFSPGGDRLLVAPGIGPMRAWDPATGEMLDDFGDRTSLGEIAHSADGSRIFSATESDEVRIWDAAEASITRTIPVSGDPTVIAIDDAALVAAGDAEGAVRLVSLDEPDAKSAAASRIFDTAVSALAFTSDGKRLAAASRSGRVVLLDVPELEAPVEVADLDAAVTRLRFSPQDDVLAAGCADGLVRLIDVEGAAPARVLVGHKGPVMALTFSPDGSRLASGGVDQTVRVWLAGPGLELLTLEGHRSSVLCVEWSPDALRIASGDAGGRVMIWDDR